eukprot:Sdes_comp17986_c0_seq1m7249
MEFPHVGSNCRFKDCNSLDFLPHECSLCHQIFCDLHFKFENHSCELFYTIDKKVPVCPICNLPIPVKYQQDPNLAVENHLLTVCSTGKNVSSLAAGSQKAFLNSCSMENCKKKEAVKFVCAKCRRNFCTVHRLESNHSCQSFQRGKKSNPPMNLENYSEEEQLKIALALSLKDSQPSHSSSNSKQSCTLS